MFYFAYMVYITYFINFITKMIPYEMITYIIHIFNFFFLPNAYYKQ